MNQALRVLSVSLTSFLTAGIGISALLIAPAVAQVNGPGPSPASSFDTVLNLPGDEAVITGSILESVGDVPGQTTQLNVSDGGTIGGLFNAGAGSEVNISGGTVGSFFDAESGSEVNISGGVFGSIFDAEEGSVVNEDGEVNFGDIPFFVGILQAQ